MTFSEILISTIIYLILPLIGLLIYVSIIKKIKIETDFNFHLLLTFVTYGGLLLTILTTVFLKWSGLASLGVFYLIIVAPIVMGAIAYKNYKYKEASIYYKWIYRLGLIYPFLIILLMLLALMFFD